MKKTDIFVYVLGGAFLGAGITVLKNPYPLIGAIIGGLAAVALVYILDKYKI